MALAFGSAKLSLGLGPRVPERLERRRRRVWAPWVGRAKAAQGAVKFGVRGAAGLRRPQGLGVFGVWTFEQFVARPGPTLRSPSGAGALPPGRGRGEVGGPPSLRHNGSVYLLACAVDVNALAVRFAVSLDCLCGHAPALLCFALVCMSLQCVSLLCCVVAWLRCHCIAVARAQGPLAGETAPRPPQRTKQTNEGEPCSQSQPLKYASVGVRATRH